MKTYLGGIVLGLSIVAGLAALVAAVPPNIQHVTALAVDQPNSLWHNSNPVPGSNIVTVGVASPTGTSSTAAFVMLGLNSAALGNKTITPATTGNVRFTVTGDMTNSTATDGGKILLAYGTGTAPANGAALTGTTVCNTINYVGGTTTNPKVPFIIQCPVTGLVIGTAYWWDLQFAAVTGGTFTIADAQATAEEE